MMERQVDIKYIITKLQEFEILKKVLFHERHVGLAPFVCLENEKRALGYDKGKHGFKRTG